MPLMVATQGHVIDLVKKHIIHTFGLLQSITVDQETMFNGEEISESAKEYDISILNSSPYYAQPNGQAE